MYLHLNHNLNLNSNPNRNRNREGSILVTKSRLSWLQILRCEACAFGNACQHATRD